MEEGSKDSFYSSDIEWEWDQPSSLNDDLWWDGAGEEETSYKEAEESDENHLGENEEELKNADKSFVAHLRRAEAVVKGIGESRGDHFEVVKRKNGTLKVFQSLHGKEFLKVIRAGCDSRCAQLPMVDKNPLVAIYHRVLKRWGLELREMAEYGLLQGDVVETVSVMNNIMADIRQGVKSPAVAELSRRVKRAVGGRKKEASLIVDSCFNSRSRIVVLRVDLGYRKGKFVDSENFLQDMDLAKKDWGLMRGRIRAGVVIPDVMAVFGKLEYGVLAGFHFHLVVIMKGAEHRQDISFAKLVGQYWCAEVTGGEGRYFNCNRIKHRYKNLGIGVMDYHENKKVDALKSIVTDYVVKGEYYISALSPREKTFFRLSPRENGRSVKRGRPRRYL